jgi:hypothetical protein
MNSRHLLSLSTLALLLTGAGCGSTSSVTPSVTPTMPTSAPAAVAPSVVADLGACNNPYYPLKKGTKVDYSSHVGKTTNSYSWEVTDAATDHVTLAYHFPHASDATTDMACGPTGIRTTTYLNLNQLSSSAATQATSKTISSSGDFLPSDLHVGSTWQNSYELEITNTNPELVKLGMGTSHMTISAQNKALDEESVTVAAGTFTAIKVESKSTMKISLGAKLPTTNTDVMSYLYFVKGKGLVKTETSGTSGGSDFGSEATSITIP